MSWSENAAHERMHRRLRRRSEIHAWRGGTSVSCRTWEGRKGVIAMGRRTKWPTLL
jgi:hypothetical protein